MTTQTMKLSFTDLTNFATDFAADTLQKTISPSSAVQVTIDAYKAGEVSNCEAYRTWATSLFKQYGPASIGDSDLNQLLELFSLTIEELLNQCQERISEEQNNKLTTFLNYSMELFTWIRSVATDFDTNEITAFLCFGLSVINNYLIVLSKQIGQVLVNKLLEKSVALQAQVLNILSENIGMFSRSGSLFSNLISHLCSVGELALTLDIKTGVNTWKNITNLVSHSVTHTQSDDTSLENAVWIKKPMSFLIKEVGRNVQTVFKENSLSEPIEQIEKYLKVTNFYLRLLQKLASDLSHVPFPICEDFLDTFALVFTPPAYICNTPVHKAIVEYLTKGLRDLTPFAYRNKSFFEFLLAESGDIKTNDAFYEILFEVIEIAIRRNEAKYLNPQLLDTAFRRTASAAKMLTSPSMYNRFIETFSSLQIQFFSKPFEKTLINGILQDDIVLALAAIDIWCTIFRSSNQSARLACFKFWAEMNERFAKFSTRLQALHVAVLLKNLYSFLSVQEKLDIWNTFNTNALNNDRFLLTIGLNAIPNSPTRESITQHFVQELLRFLKESSNNMVVDNYYTIVRDLKLLTPIAFQNDEMIEALLRYLEVTIKHKKFILLSQNILDFITAKLEFIDDRKILKILTDVSLELSIFEDLSAKLALVRFLKRTFQNARLKNHSKEMLKTFESDELTSYFGNIGNSTTEKVIIEKNENLWLEIVKNRSMQRSERPHVCRVEEELHVKKKMRMESTLLLESLEKNVDELQSLCQSEELSSSSREIIKRVVSKLQGIGALS